MKEMVKDEIFKLLDASIIYLNNIWIIPTMVMLKKSGVTMISNKDCEMELIRTTTNQCIFIDY